jgi:multidrug efflux pump subunit AcrB
VSTEPADGFFAAIVRHGTLVAVVCLIVSVVGIAASLRIPVQMIPDLDVRTISVETRWPGATPQDVEQEILLEQEEFLRTVPSLSRMTSTASSGSASIELEFPFDVDITETLIRVNNALSRVPRYPENVDQPRIVATSFSSNAFMFFRVAPLPGNPRQLDMTLMQDFLDDNVRPRMESVAGVSEVSVRGGAERQIQLLLDPAAMAALNVSVDDLRSALNARNRDISGGELEAGKRRYLLRTVGRFRDLDSLRNMVIRRDNDQLVRLADIAEVRQDHFKLRSLSFSDGDPVLSLFVRREAGSNVIAIKRAMLEEVSSINRDVLQPAGMRMNLTSDDVKYVEASIANVWTNLGIGAVFASLVLFAFLRSGKATLVGIIGIPLCTIAAFLGLLLAGRTLNVISLAGIAFAIGMTIDNAIVVLESIERQRRHGLNRLQSAVTGVQQVWPAVLASTLTTIMVFLPITLIEQEAGQLYSDIAIAVSAAILMSMLTAITLVPTLSAHMDFHGASQPQGATPRGWAAHILGCIRWLNGAAWRRLSVIGGTVLTSLAVITLLTPPAEYLPEGEEAKTFASMTAPPGYNLATMAEIAATIEQELLPHINASPEAFDSGETDIPPMQYLNLSVDPGGLRIISETVDAADIDALMDALTRRYESVPGMRGFATRGSIISSNDGGTRSISLDVAGPDLATIYQVANRIYQRAQALFGNPRIQTRPGSLTLDQPLVEIHPDWDRAAELGLDAAALGRAVAALTDGAYVDEFYLSDRKIDIFAYGPNGPGTALSELPAVTLRSDDGELVTLDEVAELRETVATNSIRRINGRRTVTLNIIPPRDVALETGVDQVRRELLAEMRANGEIPSSVSISLSGASDQLAATREALIGNFLIALVIVYLLLVAIFTHWGYPLLIMTAIPLGVAGGIVGLALINALAPYCRLLAWQRFTSPSI